MSCPDFHPRLRAGRRLPRSLAAAGILVLGAAVGGAKAQPAAAPDQPRATGAEFSVRDREMGGAIRESNGRIIRLAERALRFTPTPDVLVLAHQLLADHQRLATDLERLAPVEPGTVGRPAPLEGRVNEEFDRAFLGGTQEELERALALLATAAQSAEAPVLRAYATEAMVVLDRNLRQVREMQPGRD